MTEWLVWIYVQHMLARIINKKRHVPVQSLNRKKLQQKQMKPENSKLFPRRNIWNWQRNKHKDVDIQDVIFKSPKKDILTFQEQSCILYTFIPQPTIYHNQANLLAVIFKLSNNLPDWYEMALKKHFFSAKLIFAPNKTKIWNHK